VLNRVVSNPELDVQGRECIAKFVQKGGVQLDGIICFYQNLLNIGDLLLYHWISTSFC